jgi:hypothetical protein
MARRSMVVSDRAIIGGPSTGSDTYGSLRLIYIPQLSLNYIGNSGRA